MSDIAIVWNVERTAADWQILPGGQLAMAPGIHTAVLVSLFTDARARPDDRLPPGDTDPRGWWGDGDEPIGSRLWLLRRHARTRDTLRLAESYMAEALAWLKEDGLADAIAIAAEWQARERLAARITITRGTDRQEVAVSIAWQGV